MTCTTSVLIPNFSVSEAESSIPFLLRVGVSTKPEQLARVEYSRAWIVIGIDGPVRAR
jgi:hypothetical protein